MGGSDDVARDDTLAGDTKTTERRLNGQTLFGSDYPFISLDRWFAEFGELGLEQEAERAILAGNAARLLG